MGGHIYNDQGRCRLCRRKRYPKPRRVNRICIASSWAKGWRLFAYPLSYRVYQLMNVAYVNYPVYKEVQRFPRTRNKWVDQEFDCAVAMFERRVHQWKLETDLLLRVRFVPPLNGSYGSKVWNRLMHMIGLRREGFEDGGLL